MNWVDIDGDKKWQANMIFIKVLCDKTLSNSNILRNLHLRQMTLNITINHLKHKYTTQDKIYMFF